MSAGSVTSQGGEEGDAGAETLGPPPWRASLEERGGLDIVWPTVKQVVDHLQAGGRTALSGRKRYVTKPFLQPHYCRWDEEGEGGVRCLLNMRVMPHMKTYCRYAVDAQGPLLAWVMIGSHNLSAAAWGTSQKKVAGKPTQFMVRSYEVSVLLLPEPQGEGAFRLFTRPNPSELDLGQPASHAHVNANAATTMEMGAMGLGDLKRMVRARGADTKGCEDEGGAEGEGEREGKRLRVEDDDDLDDEIEGEGIVPMPFGYPPLRHERVPFPFAFPPHRYRLEGDQRDQPFCHEGADELFHARKLCVATMRGNMRGNYHA